MVAPSADVRGLREEVGALAEEMSEAYEEPGSLEGTDPTDLRANI